MDAEPVPVTAATAPASAPATDADPAGTLGGAEVVRGVAIGGLAGVMAGILVIGVGGRLVMRAIALLNPDDMGRITSADEVIGRITLDGSMFFIVFFGAIGGAVAAVVWVAVAEWIPGRGAARAVATGLVGVALSAFLVVRADELDFTVVEPLSAIVLLIGLVGLFGIALTLIDEQLRRRLPAVTPGRAGALLVYLLISGVGLLFMPMTLQTYFGGGDLLTRKASPEVGLAILAVGLATLAAWALRVRTGSSTRPRALRIAGQGALAIAVVLGALHLGREIAAILGATS